MRGFDRLNFGQNPSQWQEGWVYPSGNVNYLKSFTISFNVTLTNYSRTDSISGTCYWCVSTSSSSMVCRDTGSFSYSAGVYAAAHGESNIYGSGPFNDPMYIWLSLDNVDWMYVFSS